MAISADLGQFVPIAVGATLTAMIYVGGHISGAHYNPVITGVFFMENRCPVKDIIPYLLAQFLAVALAVLVNFYFSQGNEAVEIVEMVVNKKAAFLAEFLGTFALSLVILNVAMAKKLEGNGFYGAAIALIVVGGAYMFGGISCAAFNPAVTIGMALFGLLSWSVLWVYFVAQFMAAILAVYVFRFTTKD